MGAEKFFQRESSTFQVVDRVLFGIPYGVLRAVA